MPIHKQVVKSGLQSETPRHLPSQQELKKNFLKYRPKSNTFALNKVISSEKNEEF